MIGPLQYLGIQNVLTRCGTACGEDKILIVCDSGTRQLAELFATEARAVTPEVRIAEIPSLCRHGEEPPRSAADAMRSATLILALTRYSLAHSHARMEAGSAGARFLSLPLYDLDLLASPALQVDFRAQAPVVRAVADAFTSGDRVRVVTAAGTDITFDIHDRVGNFCPGFVERPGDLGSPPDIEANVAPVEDSANGLVVVDGSITHPDFGLLTEPVVIKVSQGRIVSFSGAQRDRLAMLDRIFEGPRSRRRVLAECGVGLNPAATLTGNMLTDEGALGCVHFGFGANHTVGGCNEVDFHLDFVFHSATVRVDRRTLLLEGIPQL